LHQITVRPDELLLLLQKLMPHGMLMHMTSAYAKHLRSEMDIIDK
jgi:hypothetical protein